MSYILALDAGTTGIRSIVVDADRAMVGQAYEEFTQHYPKPGWVEHDAEEIFDVATEVMLKALADADVKPTDLAGLGIANQRETVVVWDRKTSKPIHRAIVWQDRRTADACAKMRGKWGRKVSDKTGLLIDPYFSATKIAWILDNVKGARKRVDAGELAAGTIDAWLLWRLSGGKVHATDETNASRTLLWDIHTGEWHPELMEAFTVPLSVLPAVHQSAHAYGFADPDVIGAEVPVLALVGDQQASLFGHGCTAPGEAKNTYGTGCFLLQHTGTEAMKSKNGLLTTRAARAEGPPQYALEGSVFMGGAIVQWLRDGLGIIAESDDIEPLAGAVDDTGGVTFVPALTGLGAPHWDAKARGTILGMTRGTSKAHIARAALEAIALQCDDLIAAIEKDSGHKIPALRADGGASKNALLMQMQADAIGKPVEITDHPDVTAMGAALLAGIQAGTWSRGELLPSRGATFKPRRRDMKDAKKRWKKAVKTARRHGS